MVYVFQKGLLKTGEFQPLPKLKDVVSQIERGGAGRGFAI